MVIRIHGAGIGEPALRVGGHGDPVERIDAAQLDDQAGDTLVVGDLARKSPDVGARLGGGEIADDGGLIINVNRSVPAVNLSREILGAGGHGTQRGGRGNDVKRPRTG